MLKYIQHTRVLLHLGLFIMVASLAIQAQPTRGNAPNVVPGSYIVQVEDGIDTGIAAQAMAQALAGNVGHVYKNALNGFSIRVPYGLTIADVERFDWVKTAEPDIMMYAFSDHYPTGIKRINASPSVTGITDLSNSGIDVAVLDTGIDVDHPELNVVGGIHFKSNPAGRLSSDTNYDDDNGHGTHVAGTIGAKSGVATVNGIDVVGVAPGVNLWAVKVLDSRGSGYLSGIIAGIDWVTARAGTIEVANMSLGGTGVSSAYRSALQNCVNAGVVVVVAAGNENRNVYGADGILGTNDDTVPAAYPEVMTISALADYDGLPGNGNEDTLASFSNYSQQVVSGNPVNSPGAAIDLILPGVDILSTYPGGYATGSGTSMASPHAAGLVALYIAQYGRANNATGVYAIRQALIDAGKAYDSTEGWNDGSDKDNNHENLGWAGEGSAPPSDNTPPNAVDDDAVTDEDIPISITVLANDTDDDGDPLTIASVSTPTHGTAVINDDTITYTPNSNFHGTDSFTYTVSDGNGGSDTATVTITVNPINDAPVANDDSATTIVGTPVTIDVLANDSDVDSDTLTINSVTTPTHGTAVINDDTITYTPNSNFHGTDSFTYTISDGNGGSDTATVTVSVNEEPPIETTIYVTDIDSTSENNGRTWTANVSVSLNIDDGNSTTVTGEWSDGNTITLNYSGGQYTASKGNLPKNQGNINFTITGVQHDSYGYDNSANNDPDGDSNGTTIIISKP